MNGKAAKKLRQTALGIASMIEEQGVKISQRNTENDNGTIKNVRTSYRRIYQDLKRDIKQS